MQTVAARKPAMWGGGGEDRVCYEGAYGSLQPPPSVLRKHQPLTSRRGAGRSCPTKRGNRCCGRGEAAGDCIYIGMTLRTAADLAELRNLDPEGYMTAVAGIQDSGPVRREVTNMRSEGAM